MALPRLIFGVPMHPLLVHFPIAFWLTVPILDVLSLLHNPETWWPLALGATAIGAAFGVFALITGFMEYIHRTGIGVAVRLAARHGVRTSMAWLLFTVKLVIGLLNTSTTGVILVCLVLDLVACVLLLQGVVFGTILAYKHAGR